MATKPILNEVMLDEDQWRCEHCQTINRVNDWTDKAEAICDNSNCLKRDQTVAKKIRAEIEKRESFAKNFTNRQRGNEQQRRELPKAE